MYKKISAQRLFALGLCASLAACGTPAPVAYRGIESSSYMRPDPRGADDRTPFSYAAQLDWSGYSQAILMPVEIYQGADQQFDDLDKDDKTELAKYMESVFAEKLATRFRLVPIAQPNTLRIKLTLTGAATTPLAGPFTHLDIAGNLYNSVASVSGGEGLMSGAVIYAVEVYDAPTNRLLRAYISKQYPNAMNLFASFGSLGAAKTGLDKGADALVAQFK